MAISNIQRIPGILSSTLVLLVLSSCSGSEGGDAMLLKPAAKVDGQPISQQAVAEAAPNADADGRFAQLDVFVRQQLLANAAVGEKLDRDPKVLVALETARRQVLARAYASKLAATVPKPSEDEVKSYFEKHPELFTRRRSYRLVEISTTVTKDRFDDIRDHFKSLKTLNERTSWLTKENIPFSVGVTEKLAEDLPPELLSILVKHKEGSEFDQPTVNGLTVVHVGSAEDRPILLAQARSNIERFLINSRAAEILEREAKRLGEAAKIEYIAPYVRTEAAKK
jgi:EpsD family peptidyl-prolyl cis-trans isomerase